MLNLSKHVPITGTKIGAHKFVGTLSFADLAQLTGNPLEAEKKGTYDVRAVANRGLRRQIQRVFQAGKAKNVKEYARYITDHVYGDGTGITPAIVLWTPEELDIQSVPLGEHFGLEVHVAGIPKGATVIAIDGDTQLGARFIAAQQNPKIVEDQVPVLICHGKPIKWAMQAFHDLNCYGTKVNTSLALSMDAREPLTRISRAIVDNTWLEGRVEMEGRQVKKGSDEVMTFSGIATSVATFIAGTPGFAGKRVSVDDDEVDELESVAVTWYSGLLNTFRREFEDRETYLIGASSVFAALGAIGHRLIATGHDGQRCIEADRVAEEADVLIRKLKKVDWTRGAHWDGIAGKMTSAGVLTVSGPKEVGHAVFRQIDKMLGA